MNDRVKVLEGKKMLIFPDVDAYDYWKEKFKARPKLEIYISDYLQKSATEEDHLSDSILSILRDDVGFFPRIIHHYTKMLKFAY